MKPRTKKYLLLASAVLFVVAVFKGCEQFPEASFELANESRLPGWVKLPPELTRADVSLTVNYYIVFWRTAQFVLRNKEGKIIEKKSTRMGCPFKLTNPPPGYPAGYPGFEAVTVNGITEIVEHKKMEPIFYITDDDTVWKQYRSMGC